MMDLLKKLNAIKPSHSYTARSRAEILSTQPPAGIWQIFVRSIHMGSAVALAGILLIVIAGGFSTWKFLSPFQISSLDPAGLKAEAQAVDIQIELTNIAYPQAPDKESEERVAASASAPAAEAPDEAKAPAPADSATSTPTIDDVLEELAK
jgi:hypothetical protein